MNQDVQRAAAPAAWSRAMAGDYLTLTKPRITFMVVLTTLAGFYLGSEGGMDGARFFYTLLGTALVAAGSSALNMVLESSYDAKMRRTENRPLPAGRLSHDEALIFSVALALGGMVCLAFQVNLLTALLAAVTVNGYVFLYTPLKRVTPLCTLVGAVPGAIPPMGGWAAARGEIGAEAWTLFAILFLWQIPHFLAIASLYREDYAKAGFVMLPIMDKKGGTVARRIVTAAAGLWMVSLFPSLLGVTGGFHFYWALALGGLFLGFSVHAAAARSEPSAKKLLLASVIYLPLLMASMIFDKV